MRKSANFSGLTYWMVTLLGWALRASGGLSANKVAMVKNRMGRLFIFQFSANEQRIRGESYREIGVTSYIAAPEIGRQTGSDELDPAAVSYFESLFQFKCSSRRDTLTSWISAACSHSTTRKFGRGLKRDRDLKSGERVASSV